MSSSDATRRGAWWWIGVFAAALLYNLYGVTYHWTMGFMSGNEFRQAQTAITTYYIDRDNNFSLLYETPILGKPWVSILLEVPIYEWSVVLLSRATGWSHLVAARTITAACFYLTLPAIYLLLGRLAVPRPRRLLILALVLSAPVYIYYSRAFLMDSMALLGCAWFLLGFVRTMDERSWAWLALTILAGTGAALVKSATLAVWLPPAAAYGAWLLWRDLRARTGWVAPVKTLLWGLATVVVALGALRWWVVYTDPIKAAHDSAWIFTSKNLTQGNWGLFSTEALLSKSVWQFLLHCWDQAIMSRWLIGLGLLAGLLLPGVRGRVLGAGACFFLAQFLFPYAYAYQDYYFYSCAIFLHVALGFMLLGLLDARVPRWCAILVCAVPFAAQVAAYWQDYRVGQSTWHEGGYSFTELLRDLTPEKSVIIVAGADWAGVTPLYAQRKALMVRHGLETDRDYLERAFKALADEEVCALVVFREQRTNRNFIDLVAERFRLDAHAPTLLFLTADVYVARPYDRIIQLQLKHSSNYPHLQLPPGASPEEATAENPVRLVPEVSRRVFPHIRPSPFQVAFQFGIDWLAYQRQPTVSAHPNSDLWLAPAAGAREIKWRYGILPGAYEKPQDHTDGVEFSIVGELPGEPSRELYRRRLDPWQNAADRGEQQALLTYTPRPGEILRFSTRPGPSYSYDWAYTAEIKVQ
ncbi:MAG TPA: glycosyltransferase family 39 protein [Lacunisphaera sp.]|nr:glycosyltransferase family 39 protein [Lacunisphaera sp.]